MIGIHYGQMIANSGSQEAFLITAEWAGELMWAGCGVEEKRGSGNSIFYVALSRALHKALMVELF